MSLNACTVLLDVEGTTSSIAFVHEVMFPFARRELPHFLAAQWGSAELAQALQALAHDAGYEDLSPWLSESSPEAAQARILAHVMSLMDRDAKTTGLKQLQGLVWRGGFQSGRLRAHVYPDVEPALKRWRQDGLEIRIYSSGSVEAQQLFFGHTESGNLLPYLEGHYDTRIGGKRDAASYRRIAHDIQLPPDRVIFVSDVVEELVAARQAGMQAALSMRPGNGPLATPFDGPTVHSFTELSIRLASDCPGGASIGQPAPTFLE